MKFYEAAATGDGLFNKPLLFSDFDKRDKEAQSSIRDLKLMKLDKKKDKSQKHLEKLAFSKSRMF